MIIPLTLLALAGKLFLSEELNHILLLLKPNEKVMIGSIQLLHLAVEGSLIIHKLYLMRHKAIYAVGKTLFTSPGFLIMLIKTIVEHLVFLLGSQKHLDYRQLIHIKVLINRPRSVFLCFEIPKMIDSFGELIEVYVLVKIHFLYLNLILQRYEKILDYTNLSVTIFMFILLIYSELRFIFILQGRLYTYCIYHRHLQNSNHLFPTNLIDRFKFS